MDIGRTNGQKGVCRNCGQRGQWAAECPKRGKNGQGGEGEDGKGQGKKGKLDRGKTDDGKGRGKGGKHARHMKGIAITVGNGGT